jgi:cell fate regulator YaaT (PSP1 superfamily)
MGCAGCTIHKENGATAGCRSSGTCGTCGCNRLNTYDWVSAMDLWDVEPYDIVEVSFKNGARKAFYRNPPSAKALTGDFVVVETSSGYDVGRVSLSGELVRLQLKRKKVNEDSVLHAVQRVANARDLEKLAEARDLEQPTMVKARVISRTLGLDMKIGDVEFQGDKRKATFYYTADGRVDFRELIRHFAREFRVKIEMRQIGARQESARIGGLGSCGRELCCSTWLTDFKSVSTAAARYQNLAINQAKLSGQCGRLKCCLNYELDLYMEAAELFPTNADKLKTKEGDAILVKTDIFRQLMYYALDQESAKGKLFALAPQKVKEIKAMNKRGEYPPNLVDLQVLLPARPEEDEDEDVDFESVNDVLELPAEQRKKKKKKRRKGGDQPQQQTGQGQQQQKPQRPPQGQQRPPQSQGPPQQGGGGGKGRGKNRRKGGGPNRKGGDNQKKE